MIYLSIQKLSTIGIKIKTGCIILNKNNPSIKKRKNLLYTEEK